jgi:hypothetical protein
VGLKSIKTSPFAKATGDRLRYSRLAMSKLRSILGLIAGVILVLSSGAHTLLGWQALGAELAKTNTPAELVTGLEIGWKWGGAAMLAFGIAVIATFLQRYRGEPASTFVPAIVSVVYLAFGAWALVHSNYDPFFFIFIVPGVLLALASTGR